MDVRGGAGGQIDAQRRMRVLAALPDVAEGQALHAAIAVEVRVGLPKRVVAVRQRLRRGQRRRGRGRWRQCRRGGHGDFGRGRGVGKSDFGRGRGGRVGNSNFGRRRSGRVSKSVAQRCGLGLLDIESVGHVVPGGVGVKAIAVAKVQVPVQAIRGAHVQPAGRRGFHRLHRRPRGHSHRRGAFVRRGVEGHVLRRRAAPDDAFPGGHVAHAHRIEALVALLDQRRAIKAVANVVFRVFVYIHQAVGEPDDALHRHVNAAIPRDLEGVHLLARQIAVLRQAVVQIHAVVHRERVKKTAVIAQDLPGRVDGMVEVRALVGDDDLAIAVGDVQIGDREIVIVGKIVQPERIARVVDLDDQRKALGIKAVCVLDAVAVQVGVLHVLRTRGRGHGRENKTQQERAQRQRKQRLGHKQLSLLLKLCNDADIYKNTF